MHHYKIHDCIIAANQNIAGYGNGEGTTNDIFLKMDNVQLTGTIEIEKDQSKNNYLQLKQGSFGSELKAGLFKSSPDKRQFELFGRRFEINC